MEKYNIVILTSNIGAGHATIAKNLKKEFRKQAGKNCQIIDYSRIYGYYLNEGIKYTYKTLLYSFPSIYKLLYNYIIDQSGENIIDRLCAKELKRRYKGELKNTIFIALYPNAAAAISKIQCARKYVITTDYNIHKGWIHSHIDKYFIPNDETKKTLKRYGVKEDKIEITGIPIAKKFYKVTKEEKIKRLISLDKSKKTILIMGGGDGVIYHATKLVSSLSYKYNIICIAGRNHKLKEKIKNLHFPNCKVFGFTKNVEKLIQAADIVITKAGGLSMTEIITMQKPVIVYKQLPGQEALNSQYFEKHKACVIAKTIKEVDILVSKILSGKISLNTKFLIQKGVSIDQVIGIIKKDL
jgi:processive 1,2-diacylglycerol beta-glucosyltransferase